MVVKLQIGNVNWEPFGNEAIICLERYFHAIHRVNISPSLSSMYALTNSGSSARTVTPSAFIKP